MIQILNGFVFLLKIFRFHHLGNMKTAKDFMCKITYPDQITLQHLWSRQDMHGKVSHPGGFWRLDEGIGGVVFF